MSSTSSSESPPASITKSMSVLALIGLVDSISYMAVAPSLIFYVLQVGGDKELYGLVMSAFSFASFCGKPVYGLWVDRRGNKFRLPYLVSFSIAVIGAVLYFMAAAFESQTAIALILVGRLLSGFGGANQTLGYAYIASVVSQDQQTRTNTILSMTRIIGMAMGPIVNLLLAKIETTISLPGGNVLAVGPLNSVGILLAAGNLLVMAYVFWMLEEPPEKESKKKFPIVGAATAIDRHNVWDALCCIEILLPIVILLVVNSSFQLIETAFPAAAADGLGWGPVGTSAVLGSTSFVIFFCMILTIVLSGKVHDLAMVGIGNILWIFGGAGMYLFWKRDAPTFHYVVPIVISCMGFPFIAASNRSNYTKAVASEPSLEELGALMQSVLSMAASVAGFVTPGLVAAYVIRSPEEVTASLDQRELTPVALYVPIMPCFVLVGLWYSYRKAMRLKKEIDAQEATAQGGLPESETTGLLSKAPQRRRSSVVAIGQAFSRQSEVARRMSTQMMGLTAFDTQDEKDISNQLLRDMEEWKELVAMDYDEK